ncbi:MAG: hypothetical protein HYZ53_26465 [Planctomycetes bacterium]|nr:hypothetical protein [Planctomycetota bacterium]
MKEGSDIARFVRVNADETLGREFHIFRGGHRRFPVAVCGAILIGLVPLVIPGLLLLAYFATRRLKTREGFTTVTKDRVILYEHCDHPEENFHGVQQVNIADISAIKLVVRHTLLRHEFALTIWTPSALSLAVGARGGLLSALTEGELEPGPDADEFLQEVSSLVTGMRMKKDSAGRGSKTSSSAGYY